MNVQDASILRAERDADPERWHDYDPNNTIRSRYDAEQAQEAAETPAEARDAPVEEVEREGSLSSSGSSMRDASTIQRHRSSTVVSRSSTRMEYELMEYLDRHPTAIKRVQERELTHISTITTFKLMLSCRSSSTLSDSRIVEDHRS